MKREEARSGGNAATKKPWTIPDISGLLREFSGISGLSALSIGGRVKGGWLAVASQ